MYLEKIKEYIHECECLNNGDKKKLYYKKLIIDELCSNEEKLIFFLMNEDEYYFRYVLQFLEEILLQMYSEAFLKKFKENIFLRYETLSNNSVSNIKKGYISLNN